MNECYDLWPKIFCRAIRPETGTWVWIELPFEIGKSGNPTYAMEWVMEKYNYQFIPMKFKQVIDNNQVEEMLNVES